MDEQIKHGLPNQCMFLNADGQIMNIEYGKPGFHRSELSTDNQKANREIVNRYNERHGITAEQVKMMHRGALFGWEKLQIPDSLNQWEANMKGNCIFEIEISNLEFIGSYVAAKVSLPATPYENVDALDKTRVTVGKTEYVIEILESPIIYLPQFIDSGINLYELNYLAHRLAAFEPWELDCFEGMLMIDTIQTSYAPVPIDRLINMTHSTVDCQVVYEAQDDLSLGKFYADNGFVPELESLPENVFKWLDYKKIGKELRENERGIFTPDGYVVLNGEISQIYKSGDAIPADQPDYTVLLKVSKVYFNNSQSENDLSAFIKLPIDSRELYNAVREVGAASRKECVLTAVDCIIPRLTRLITDGSFDQANELAKQLQNLEQSNSIPVLKAMLEAAPKDINLEDVSELANHTGDFSILREAGAPVNYAEKEIWKMLTYDSDMDLEKYFDLSLFGWVMMAKNGIVKTSYGLLEPRDGRTVEQYLVRPDISEPCMKIE